MIYFDYSATSPLDKDAMDGMIKVMQESQEKVLGNPSSLHTPGSIGKGILEKAHNSVAKLIKANPTEIIFTSGGSESNNTVLSTFKDCPILISKIEHPSVINPATEYGNPCEKIPVDEKGIISTLALKEKLEEFLKSNYRKRILVSVMAANNEIGILEPLEGLSSLIEEYRKKGLKLYFHSDATQAIGKIPIDVKELHLDYLTISAHKLGGPVGIGALYVRTGAPFRPLILGGEQENKRRAGTSNAVLAEGFRIVAKKAQTTPKIYEQKIRPLKNQLATEIKKRIPTAIVLTSEPSLPNILNVSFPAAEGESTQLYLDLEGIAVSTGSACASGDLEPSHVIMSMYGDAKVAHNSIRFSLGLDTKKSEIDSTLEKLPPIIDRLQKISTINLKRN